VDVIWSNPPCSSRAIWNWLPRSMSRWLLSISKEGYFTTCLGNLSQCWVTLTVKKCFLLFRRHLLCSVCSHCLWSCSEKPLATVQKIVELAGSMTLSAKDTMNRGRDVLFVLPALLVRRFFCLN